MTSEELQETLERIADDPASSSRAEIALAAEVERLREVEKSCRVDLHIVTEKLRAANSEGGRLRQMIDEQVGSDVRFVAFEKLGELTEQNAALREITQAVANYSIRGKVDRHALFVICPFCETEGDQRWPDFTDLHTPGCVVARARALLGDGDK